MLSSSGSNARSSVATIVRRHCASYSCDGFSHEHAIGTDDASSTLSTGAVEITVTNYNGGAASALALEVVQGPPPVPVL